MIKTRPFTGDNYSNKIEINLHSWDCVRVFPEKEKWGKLDQPTLENLAAQYQRVEWNVGDCYVSGASIVRYGAIGDQNPLHVSRILRCTVPRIVTRGELTRVDVRPGHCKVDWSRQSSLQSEFFNAVSPQFAYSIFQTSLCSPRPAYIMTSSEKKNNVLQHVLIGHYLLEYLHWAWSLCLWNDWWEIRSPLMNSSPTL